MWHVHIKFRDIAGGAPQIRAARTCHLDAIEQTHAAIHLQAKVGDASGGDGFENIYQRMADVVGQLQRRCVLPVGGNSLEAERRKLALVFIGKREVELRRLVRPAMAQNGSRLTRIVVAVVKKENNLAADFLLQPPGGLDFGDEKPFWKKPARLLAKADDRRVAHEK
jgi:hypothetical protein